MLKLKVLKRAIAAFCAVTIMTVATGLSVEAVGIVEKCIFKEDECDYVSKSKDENLAKEITNKIEKLMINVDGFITKRREECNEEQEQKLKEAGGVVMDALDKINKINANSYRVLKRIDDCIDATSKKFEDLTQGSLYINDLRLPGDICIVKLNLIDDLPLSSDDKKSADISFYFNRNHRTVIVDRSIMILDEFGIRLKEFFEDTEKIISKIENNQINSSDDIQTEQSSVDGKINEVKNKLAIEAAEAGYVISNFHTRDINPNKGNGTYLNEPNFFEKNYIRAGISISKNLLKKTQKTAEDFKNEKDNISRYILRDKIREELFKLIRFMRDHKYSSNLRIFQRTFLAADDRQYRNMSHDNEEWFAPYPVGFRAYEYISSKSDK